MGMEQKQNLERILWYKGNDKLRMDKRQLRAETPYDMHGSAWIPPQDLQKKIIPFPT
jgi:hypothetical protein